MKSQISKILSQEHENILKIILFLEKECGRINKENKIDIELDDRIIEFIRNYADKFHHAKEESILFEEMEKNSSELACNPIKQMLYEHDEGRKAVKGMEEAILENNPSKFISNSLIYIELLRNHIFKEDNILYPMAEESLDKKTKEKIIKRFAEVQRKMQKEKTKYEKFARGLK